ncbi:MAG TPA: branched-chain amino acid ABC transporter permease [Chloroflexota bacterium]|jgi:branched-chain amino acid transport system permease protein|nr:branched-chain amino acid ABC transporter permease [Chloroflexota bacterium]
MKYASIVFAVIIVLFMAIVPPVMGGYAVQALTSYLISGLLALAVGLITGYGRLFNLGVGANFGVSAYAVAILTHQGITEPFTLFAVAIIAGVVVSLLFAFYALIASGVEYLMLTFLTTLAFASIPHAANDLTGGDNGLTVNGGLRVSFGLSPLAGNGFYWFVLGIVVLCTCVSWYVLASQTGKAIQAIGRNPSRAAAMGYSVAQYRVALTVFSSVIASIGGWLFALQRSFVFIDLLGLANSTNGLVYALVGGVDSILGPLLGAALLRALTDQLSRGSTQSSLYIGIVLMLVVYFLPDGLVGLWRSIRARYGLQFSRPTPELGEKQHGIN